MKINKKICLRIVFTILLLSTFVIIFMFSSQNGDESSSLSQGFIYNILKNFTNNTVVIENIIIKIEPLIRKIAHFSIYALVGVWSTCLMETFDVKEKQKIVTCILIGFLYSCTDEIHQLFISERSGSILDVLLDTFGTIFRNFYHKNNYKNYKKTY